LNTPPDHPTDPAAWLARGQQLEAQATLATLAEAVRSYDCAAGILRSLASDHPASRRDLAIAQMNRGNALQKIGTAEALADSLRSYDEAIALLGAPGFENNFPARNSLGAAWMNRGLALHRQASANPELLDEALRSHREAIAVLRPLPLDESPWFRRNLSAAWTNLANALLDSRASDRFTAAADAARTALSLIAAEEDTEPVDADLALKARRCLCDALGHVLALNEAAGLSNDATGAETSDAVDAALALIRHWEQQGLPAFRALAARFFRFGAHFYRLHQPHFLAEFVLENLDPESSPGAIADAQELHAIADEAISVSLAALRAPRLIHQVDPALLRELQTSRDLQSAERRLADLRRSGFPGSQPNLTS
jgi:hypothetical protein